VAKTGKATHTQKSSLHPWHHLFGLPHCATALICIAVICIPVQQRDRKDTGRMRKATKKPTEEGPKAVASKKSRMKEAKETRTVFETIAKKLLHESSLSANQKMENFCLDLINRRLTDVRQDVVMIESSLSARIGQLEYKINDVNSKLTELSTNVVHQNTLLREELCTFTQKFSTGMENERNKRLVAMKKMHNLAERGGGTGGTGGTGDAEGSAGTAGNASANVNVNANAVSALGDELRVQSRELARLRENVDGM
jgi:TolA-binding protein